MRKLSDENIKNFITYNTNIKSNLFVTCHFSLKFIFISDSPMMFKSNFLALNIPSVGHRCHKCNKCQILTQH